VSNTDANWYSQQIKRVPMLTPAEEITLGSVVQEWLNFEGGPEQAPPALQRRGRRAQNRMVEANLRLVVSVANKYSRQVPSAEYMDLVQAGNIGLVRAVEKFDPTRGYKFSTYAYWWIRQGVSRHIETQTRVIRLPSSVMQKLHDVSNVTRRLALELDRTPTKAEVAHVLEITASELEQLLSRGQACLSLDAHARGDDSLSSLGDLIADPNGADNDEQLDQLDDEHTTQQLLQCLGGLNERQRFMIEGTIGIDQPAQSISALAKQLGIQPSQASKLLREAKLRLRWLITTKTPHTHPKPSPPPLPTAYVELVNQLELAGWAIDRSVDLKRRTIRKPRKPHPVEDCIQSSFW